MNHLLSQILIILSLCGLIACSQDEANEFSNDPDLKGLKSDIESYFNSNEYIISGLDTIFINSAIKNLYAQRSFEPIWYEAKSQIQLKEKVIQFFKEGYLFGLDTSFFMLSSIQDNQVYNDILLTRNYLLFNTMTAIGADYARDTNLVFCLDSIQFNPEKINSTNWQWKEWHEHIANYEPRTEDYKKLKKHINSYVKNNIPLDTLITFSNNEVDSVKLYHETSKILQFYKYLPEDYSVNDTANLISAIKIFQIDNGLEPDALLGKFTIKALKKNNYDRWKQLAVNLNRARRNQIKDEEFLYVNIPQYTLRWFRNDTVFSQHKVIVGSTENQTPEFHSNMRSIVLYPTWHVPFSISTEEILPALRRDSNYLEKKGYALFSPKGDSVSTVGIDWKKYSDKYFPYRIRQSGGSTNSLGLVKFLFPNEHSVYLHDTPGRYLFRNSMRAYSHGCIRLENPLDFGAALLERELDTAIITSDSLRVLIDSSLNNVYKIRKQLTIYIDYRTIDPYASDEKPIFYTDIYNRDEQWWDRMSYKKKSTPKKENLVAAKN